MVISSVDDVDDDFLMNDNKSILNNGPNGYRNYLKTIENSTLQSLYEIEEESHTYSRSSYTHSNQDMRVVSN